MEAHKKSMWIAQLKLSEKSTERSLTEKPANTENADQTKKHVNREMTFKCREVTKTQTT